MSDTISNTQPVLTPKQQLENMEQVRDLFARAHDYIAQASHPGHLGAKVAEVLSFLQFHYADFKNRAEGLARKIENDIKAELSKVNVEAAKVATDAVLSDEHGAVESGSRPAEQPKA